MHFMPSIACLSSHKNLKEYMINLFAYSTKFMIPATHRHAAEAKEEGPEEMPAARCHLPEIRKGEIIIEMVVVNVRKR